MSAIEIAELRRLPLLADLAQEFMPAILDGVRLIHAPPHEMIFDEGAPADFLHIVLDGAVELFTRIGEQEGTFSLLEPGGVFVLAAVANEGSRYPISARTLRASRILTLPAAVVRYIFDRDAAFATAVARQLSDEFNGLFNDLKNQKLLTSTERLADWLLRTDVRLGGTRRLTLPFDKGTLASQLGMTPEQFSRSLKWLSSHGLSVVGRRLVLSDPAALADVASRRARPNGSRHYRRGNGDAR